MSSSTPSVVSLKRKATSSPSNTIGHTLVLPPPTHIGPAFVNFPAIRPAHNTVFKVYRRDQQRTIETPLVEQQSVIACETQDVEYYSINKDLAERANEQFSCEYLPVLYDSVSGKMVIQPAIPTYVLAQRVKRTKVSDMLYNSALTFGVPNLTKRDQLGEAFGTRKAKSRIRANERNKVDASAQESVREHLMQHIDDATMSIPPTDSQTGIASVSPLIPWPNMTAFDPSQVYSLDILIPQEEASAIDVKPLIVKNLSDRDRMNMLPFCGSRWIEAKMRMALELPLKEQEKTL
ncbi:hypothetical protein QFC21_002095 [Naganishia friedmannii]|uniref:Uncharacterized protein n=1 Tax=Naganishia friedmannii TaxID=89922 RepID=A0ACC2W1T5_9TREE|nr:hypothetical protein QFC21_002095 [Naganishia friedmannii]